MNPLSQSHGWNIAKLLHCGWAWLQSKCASGKGEWDTKDGFLLGKSKDIGQTREIARESVEIYNTRRPHMSYKMADEPEWVLAG